MFRYRYYRPERNPYTGRRSAGFRFRFHVRAISHRNLFLPLQMKSLPQIQQLLLGVSPLEVFKCHSIQSARKAFNELRKQFDFPYWAVTEYYVRDIHDADQIVPLWLNYFQHKIVDTFIKRYFKKQIGNYIITKSFPKCGVTTCVQAYILWMQINVWPKHSNTCAASEINLNPIKTNLCRFLKRDIVPDGKHIYLPKADHCAFFNTYRTPDALRGIDFGYVHLADMSRWYDQDGDDTSRAHIAAIGGVLPTHRPLIVLEGNVPKPEHVDLTDPKFRKYGVVPYDFRRLCRNPYFLLEAAYSYHTFQGTTRIHIDLDL